jgi:hypothetical protein
MAFRVRNTVSHLMQTGTEGVVVAWCWREHTLCVASCGGRGGGD